MTYYFSGSGRELSPAQREKKERARKRGEKESKRRAEEEGAGEPGRSSGRTHHGQWQVEVWAYNANPCAVGSIIIMGITERRTKTNRLMLRKNPRQNLNLQLRLVK